uniref:Calponin-homology (CH) domain-containing protein n=1 Tax=Glossina austeni TaxID=7395 RepID=A0A1A9VTQ0_GLOAU
MRKDPYITRTPFKKKAHMGASKNLAVQKTAYNFKEEKKGKQGQCSIVSQNNDANLYTPVFFASCLLSKNILPLQKIKKRTVNMGCSVGNSESIYTDWANYYLERAKSKKKVTDLSSDCRDGLLLAEIIEAVTSFKVPDLHKKPKNQQQMQIFLSSSVSKC